MPIMTIKDVEKLQTAINDAGLDYDMELENGRISIVGPYRDWEIGILFSLPSKGRSPDSQDPNLPLLNPKKLGIYFIFIFDYRAEKNGVE